LRARIRFLGSGDAFGSGGRFQACIHVACGGKGMLLDCGASSLVAMRRFDVEPNSIGAVVISHLHGDHFAGIPFFVLDAQLVSRREQPLIIAGPPGIERRVIEAMEVLFPGSSTAERRFETQFVEMLERSPTEIAGATVTAFEVAHASGAPPLALRIQMGDRTLAYSGDTEWTPALGEAAEGADLFICEAYYFDKKMKYHLDYETLASHAEELGCKRMILTHMSSNMLRRLPDLGVEAAFDGLEVDV
jgi:ribonuclease BN (tRNA processing enzyme)